jgi:hypothetical protein
MTLVKLGVGVAEVFAERRPGFSEISKEALSF